MVCAGAGGGFNAATRCEAFGALRAAAATHTSAVASMWGAAWGLDGILPAVTCSSSSGGGTGGTGGGGESGSGSGVAGAGASEVGGDRLAQASARFLADYLLAVGGGGGGGGGLYKLNPVNP